MQNIEIKKLKNIEYAVTKPKNYDEGKKYPIIFEMHGAGNREQGIECLCKENYLVQKAINSNDFQFVVITPYCHADTWFDIFENLIELLKSVPKMEFADANRIYGIGASMGAYGLWQLAMSCPDIFAAIVPICGGGMYWNAGRLKNVPVWAFHGKKDSVVFVHESEQMVDAVNKAGGNAKLTIYPENEHDAWSDTYSNSEVFDWMLKYIKFN